MNTITKASTKSAHNVYLENGGKDGCILEVKRKGRYFVYEISDTGVSSLIVDSSVPYTPEPGQKDEVYFLDYLSASCLQKIHTLTENYNYTDLILNLIKIKTEICSDSFHVSQFSMDHANVFEDYKEVLKQLAEFTSDPEYNNRLDKITKFFDDLFFETSGTWTEDELHLVQRTFSDEIKYLEQLQAN
jgi:hypothetical protein